MIRLRSRRSTVVGTVVAVALGIAGVVGAFWSTGSNPGGNGHASAGALPAGATPTVLLAGRTATVSWAQSSVVGSPLGQLAGGAYTITRRAESDPGTAIPAGGSCAGSLSGAADPMTCTEPSLPTGRWSYDATPTLFGWIGGASPQSAGLVIAPDPPTSVALVNGGGTGSVYVNTVNQASLTFAVVLPATSLASDTVTLSLTDGATTVTASDAGIAGGGTRTFSGIDASGLADGPITVSAIVASSYGDLSTPAQITRTKDTVAPTLTSLLFRDNNSNGKVDRAVAGFSEALAAYSAGTSPWTLSNVPSGGSLASVAVAANNATLTISEGAGAPDTAVGSFTIALTSNASGIRDAAGNQTSFTTSTPTDAAKPILVTGSLAMKDIDGNGKVDRVSADFSEPLAASTDTAAWTLASVPSGGSLASVTTSANTASLTITEGAGAANTAVGSFRVTLAASATGIRDAAGNQSSFGSTAPTDQATPVLVSLAMQDSNSNGKVDRAVAGFSEALAAYSAGTSPWTLSNVPSGGSLASVAVAASNATLTISEGAGAPDTAVGSFTIALTSNASGIRDAAGNQTSFTTSTPTDAAKPILVTGSLAMKDIDGNGKVDRVSADFSEPLAASTDTAAWTLASVPSGGSLASVTTSANTASLTITEGAGAANTAVGSFRVTLAASATGIRDAAGNQSSFGSTAPTDQATPVLVSLAMQDSNSNGKVDRAVAGFSEALAAYSAGTSPWTLSNVPSGGSLASVAVAASNATLTISEGAGAPDTAVGSFTIALTSNASGIRDAAGNQTSFTTSTPTDAAKPILVTGSLAMKDIDGNGKVDRVSADFSEPLAASTDTAAWTLASVPSGGSLASVTTSANTASLTITEGAGAANTAVGSFRVTLAASATGIRDAAGNQSSFGSTAPTDQATPVLVSLAMQDSNSNGKVDRAVAGFSEALAAYSAGTSPWTLSNVPSGGSLASVAVAASNATLTISEGAGAPDTAVGSFTIALTSNASGIRDAAGNQTSFTTSTPTDAAKPILVTGSLAMKDIDGNGKVDRVSADFSEPLAASTDTAAWTLASVPSGGSLASVTTSANTASLTITEGAGAANTAVGSFRVTLAASATGIRDAAGNQSSFGSTAPTDQATPVLVSLAMQDSNSNGKVDRAVAGFSEALAAYSAGTSPWTLSNVPSGGSLASVAVAASNATLTISEGAGAPDTAVGSFTIALTSNASGIRDAAGNQTSFTTSTPTDAASPVPIGVTSANNGLTAGFVEAGDTFTVTFSEAIATAVGPNATITETDPSGAGNDRLTIPGLTTAAGVVTGSNLYIATDNTSASFGSSTISKAGAVITATVAGTCSGTCGANIGIGIGILVFIPDPALQDAAGNGAAGSFTTLATFRLF